MPNIRSPAKPETGPKNSQLSNTHARINVRRRVKRTDDSRGFHVLNRRTSNQISQPASDHTMLANATGIAANRGNIHLGSSECDMKMPLGQLSTESSLSRTQNADVSGAPWAVGTSR